ncbi:hypothetical protein Slin14017_G045740 [Septoria linicola]|nr:hypothetical protein Slin14017_G045740 [Septoria linicola]
MSRGGSAPELEHWSTSAYCPPSRPLQLIDDPTPTWPPATILASAEQQYFGCHSRIGHQSTQLMAPKSHSKSTKRFSATHHGIILVLLDIDASKKDAAHLDYKYRDQASRIRAIELLIQQYASKVLSKDGEYKDSEPEKLYNAMRKCSKDTLHWRRKSCRGRANAIPDWE